MMLDRRLVFLLFYSTLASCILAQANNANLDYASFPANENGTCYKRVPYDEALAVNISRGIVKTPPGSQQAGVKTNSNRGWLTIIDCCEGFIRNKSTGKCETHCDEGCFGGTCTGPNVCTCEDGWRPEAGVCKPICRRGCADNAYCFSPDICTCKFGYEEEEGICKPVCRYGCRNGQCVAPRDCRCNPGYYLNETQRCEPVCEGGCPHGRCVQPGICECNRGYTNPENDPETCTPSCPDTCTSTNGRCHSPNVCTCDPGYTQTPSGTCIPECLGDCPNGRCVAPEQCECNQGFVMNRQLRRCVEGQNGRDGYYENPAVNRSRGNNYDNPTIPPETTYGGRGTYRPEDSSQLRGPDQGLKRPQNYDVQQPGRAYGTQGIVQNRNRPDSEQEDMYGTTGQYEDAVALNQTQNNSRVIGLKGGVNRQNIPGTYPTSENNNRYTGYRNNSTGGIHRPANSQGPFAPLEPYDPDGQRLNQTNPRDRNPQYETYGNSQTPRPLRPVNQQGPFPSQGPYPSQGYYNETHGSDGRYYGDRRNNQTRRPYQGPYGSQGPYPGQGPYSTPAPGQGLYPKLPPIPGQDPYAEGPYSGQGPHPTQETFPGQGPYSTPAPGQGLYPKLPRIPGQGPVSTHDPRDFESPYGPQYNGPTPDPLGAHGQNPSQRLPGNNQPYQPLGPYGIPARGQPGNPHETLGLKGGRRPWPDSSRNPGVDIAYGVNEMQNLPQNGNVNPRPGQTSVIVGLYDPYNPVAPGNDGTDNIYVLDPSMNHGFFNPYLPPGSPPQLDPGFAPFKLPGYSHYRPTCDSPCVNSVCVGNNVCQCKPGYEPDPINPNGFKCVPSCPGGCVNGVCSGPDLCICNAGFVKERGGFSRCHHSVLSSVSRWPVSEQQNMEFSAIVLFVLAVIARTESVYRFSDFVIHRNCTEVFSITTPKYVPYEESYRTRNWLGFTKWKTRTNYRIENHVSYQRRSVCCSGYTNYGSSMCIPICSKSCGSYGVCSEPETCKCFQGYSMDHSINDCRPVCSNECVNGKCTAPNTCVCNNGFHKLSDGYTCTATCNTCTSLELCVEPHICRCKPGYRRSSLDRLDWIKEASPCEPICDKPCVNADCVSPNVCKCHEGYEDLDDDVYTCEPRCSHGCGLDGYCTAPETCTCRPGYALSHPGSNICIPICTDECVNGNCVAPDRCNCKDGYAKTGSDFSHICHPVCNSRCTNGYCSEPNKCICLPGYAASNDYQTCEPVCKEPCHMGTCTAPDTCTCHKGYKLSEHSNFTCEPHCDSGCDHGLCSDPNKCICYPGYAATNEFQTCEPVCKEDCHMGTCTAPDTCTCHESYRLSEDNNFACEPICSLDCINGNCTAPNECTCDDGYEMKNGSSNNCIVICECQNGFCNDDSSTCKACSEGFDLTVVEGNSTLCQPHCEGNCSSHGQCVEPQSCDCDENYVADNDTLGNPVCLHACGGDCQHGTCEVGTGLCSCYYGWAGKFCEEAIACVLRIYNDTKISLRPSEWDGYDDSGNWTVKEDPWTGPTCHERCLHAMDNSTKCLNQTDVEANDWLTCYMSIESSCNTHSVVMANLYKSDVNVVTIIASCAIMLLTLATVVSATLIFKKKKRNQRRDTIAMTSSEQEQPEAEEDRLIENDTDGISL
ncbi:hypothetical protein TSAR_008146 [Trichomalopsis sarcophagae]|uniref:EGF-like domain-containing protein n=1 Tax=Trichomalopsis sarcophagae TaxID=543379 RepID=A0A232EH23_9HYME|nr:hypothetical protein TSAR_008146 [Trichomalopsis sarcophagae]